MGGAAQVQPTDYVIRCSKNRAVHDYVILKLEIHWYKMAAVNHLSSVIATEFRLPRARRRNH